MSNSNDTNENLETVNHTAATEFVNQEVEELKEKIKLMEEDVLRARAAAENSRKRAEEDIIKNRKFSLEKLLKQLLPIADSIEKGIENAEKSAENSILEGLKLTQKLIVDLLAKEGVKIVNPIDQQFDPNYHEAIGTESHDEKENNNVVKVIQNGYTLHERSIRNALVIVNKKQ